MASVQDTQWALLAGQEVAGGVRVTPQNSPMLAFGQPLTQAGIASLQTINGLLPKIGKTIIHSKGAYQPEILRIFNRYEIPYGAAVEDFQFIEPTPNVKADGKCIPRQTNPGAVEYSAANLAGNYTVNVHDKEVNKGLLSETEVSQYIAAKMQLIEAGHMDALMTAAIQLFSDCVPGKRAITSSTSSDGQGTTVSYAATPKGYAGQVKSHADWVIPEVSALGSEPALKNEVSGESNIDMVLDFLQEIKSLAAGMKYPSKTFNKLGVKTFSKSLKVVMETHVLDAFDRVIQDQSKNYYEGATARGFIKSIAGAELVEIPAFAAIPTYDSTTYASSTDYTGQRLACAIVDAEVPRLMTFDYSMESQRCMGERMTSYNLKSEQSMSMYGGANSAVILVDHTAD